MRDFLWKVNKFSKILTSALPVRINDKVWQPWGVDEPYLFNNEFFPNFEWILVVVGWALPHVWMNLASFWMNSYQLRMNFSRVYRLTFPIFFPLHELSFRLVRRVCYIYRTKVRYTKLLFFSGIGLIHKFLTGSLIIS